MKKILLICLCFFSVFTCLTYAFPKKTRFEKDTESAYFANDCLVWKQQNLGAIDVGKFDKSNDLLVPPPNIVVAQYDDKPPLAGRIYPSSVKHDLTGDITVSINPAQNQCFVCKDMPFILIASVTNTAANRSVAGATYNWYYVQDDGTQVPIIADPPRIIIAGNTITFLKGNISLTTTAPYGATVYSVLDNFPGLSDVVSAGQNALSATANNLMPDFTKTPFSQIKTAIDGILPQAIKDEITNAATNTAKDKIKDLIPSVIRNGVANEFSVPIGVDVVVGAETVSATPFTRPAFDRPHAATYTVGPLTCCEGEAITFNNIDTNNPDLPTVMYTWVGFPGTPDLSSTWGTVGTIANIGRYVGKRTLEDAGLGNAFLLNPSKACTQKGPVSITMGNRFAYTGNYTLMAFRGAPSPAGCSSFAKPTKVNVYGKPTSDKNTKLKTSRADNTFCEGDKIDIKSNSSGRLNDALDALLGTITYEWYHKGTLTNTSENFTINNATSASAGIYTRIAKTNKGCKTAATITINISPKPAPPTGLTSNSPICVGDNLVISVSRAVGVTAYEWAGPRGAIRTSTTSTLTITSAQQKDMGTYSVKAKDANNCLSDAATITIGLVANNLAALLTIGSNAPVVEGAHLALSATSIPGATYEWKGPNGFSSNISNPTVNQAATSAMSGAYTLTIKKCTYSATKPIQVQVLNKSVLDILNSDLTRTICSLDQINIPLSSMLSGVKYLWRTSAESGITGFTPSKRDVSEIKETLINNRATSGTITYTVTPIFHDGTKEVAGNSKDFVITVVPIAKATIKNESKTEKNIVSSTWKPISTGAAVTYTWYSGPNKTDKITSGVKKNGDYTFQTPTPGTYTRYVTTQQAGDPCESEPTKLELKVEHDITLSFDHSTITQGGSAILAASLPGGVKAPAGGITITLQHTKSSFAISPTIYIPVGSPSAFITVVTTKSRTMDDDENISFTGTKADPYTIIGPSDLTIKKDRSLNTITLKFNQASVNGGEHATLTAKLPDGILATHPIEIQLEADDDHSTAEEDENYKDLETSMTIDIGANSKTIKAFTAKNKGVIDGLTHLVLEATAPRGYSIADPKPKISISDTTGDDPANRVMTLAFKKASVIGGDTDELIISLPKGIVSANDITVELKKDENTGKGSSKAKQGVDYERFPGKIDIPAYKNYVTYPLKTLGDDKVSKITTMAISGMATGYEFKSLAKVNIISGLHVPNVFTPGGVGDHPTWIITGLHLYPNCDVKVFNRYGQIVFKSQGYAEPWNGGYQNNLGKEMPVGTYYYVIQLNSSHKGAKRVLKGHVAIIR